MAGGPGERRVAYFSRSINTVGAPFLVLCEKWAGVRLASDARFSLGRRPGEPRFAIDRQTDASFFAICEIVRFHQLTSGLPMNIQPSNHLM